MYTYIHICRYTYIQYTLIYVVIIQHIYYLRFIFSKCFFNDFTHDFFIYLLYEIRQLGRY